MTTFKTVDAEEDAVDLAAPPAPEVAAQLAAYLAKPYHLVLQAQPEGGYGAWVAELPNCVAGGSTPEEALAMLRDAMAGWLLVSLEAGDDIPEPALDWSGPATSPATQQGAAR